MFIDGFLEWWYNKIEVTIMSCTVPKADFQKAENLASDILKNIVLNNRQLSQKN